MPGFLHNLENNEAILLMYLMDELPAEDRAEVEQQLSQDAALRRELDELKQAWAACTGALEAADAVVGQPMSEGAAARRASRLVRQWATERLARPAPAPRERKLPFPWWTYPLATAACVLIGFLAVWGLWRPSQSSTNSIADNTTTSPAPLLFSHLTVQEQSAYVDAVNTEDSTDLPPTTAPTDDQSTLPQVADSNLASLDAIQSALMNAQSSDAVENILSDLGGAGDNSDQQGMR